MFVSSIVEDGLSHCRGKLEECDCHQILRQDMSKILSLYLSSASSNIHITEMCTCFVEDNSFHLIMDSKVFFMYE